MFYQLVSKFYGKDDSLITGQFFNKLLQFFFLQDKMFCSDIQ